MANSIAVIAAGVIGLGSGIELLRTGDAATIFARELPHHTTSAVPAAICFRITRAGSSANELTWLERTASSAA